MPWGWTRSAATTRETPEVMVPQMLFTATEAIGFAYGVTWNTVRRNIFNWKHEEVGNLEAKVKSFCAIPQVLALPEGLHRLCREGRGAAEDHPAPAPDRRRWRRSSAAPSIPQRTRGLVWHTQGSGKTFTMIKAAELLFKAPEADKPTILLMIDRNELEDQMLKNLAALGLGNVEHAGSIARLNQLLRDDYRGIIVTMIHKFRDMPANLNTRSNIYVLIDEAHRTTGGDLGNFLMAGLPNATFIGFTGTPVDKTAYGKGTFKTFGCEDDKGYLHKYSIAESIEDGTTLPLYYQLAPNEMLVPHETLEKEFLVAGRNRRRRRHRGAEQDPRAGGEPEELPQGQGAHAEGGAVRRRPLPRERRAARLQGVPRRRGPRGLRPLQGGARSIPAAGVFRGRLSPATTTTRRS